MGRLADVGQPNRRIKATRRGGKRLEKGGKSDDDIAFSLF